VTDALGSFVREIKMGGVLMRFDIWRWLLYKEDFILSALEVLSSARHFYGLTTMCWRRKGNAIIAKHRKDTVGKDVVIVLNGPSINQQPLERLRGRDLVFVNQGFRHPAYRELQPKYHVIIDTKLINGVWDVKWLDEIHEMVPGITFVLPATWARLPLLRPYVANDYSIIWIGGCIGGLRGIGVSGECFNLVRKLGYERIYFTGFEATSFPAGLLRMASHFYGNDSDEESGRTGDIIDKGYYMNARQYHELVLLARKFEREHVDVCNLTEGGILEMFPRKKFEDVFPA